MAFYYLPIIYKSKSKLQDIKTIVHSTSRIFVIIQREPTSFHEIKAAHNWQSDMTINCIRV